MSNKLLAEQMTVMLEKWRASHSYAEMRYNWRRAETEPTVATGWNGGDKIGEIVKIDDVYIPPNGRWLWSVSAKFAPLHRGKVACSGFADDAVDAAICVEIAYDVLMRLNDR